MTEEEQQIAIAEACGLGDYNTSMNGWHDEYIRQLPDYLNDLNAMHEAEKVLTDEQMLNYLDALLDVLGLNLDPGGWYIDIDSVWQMTHATASQRAEAFLRTIGKWEESK